MLVRVTSSRQVVRYSAGWRSKFITTVFCT